VRPALLIEWPEGETEPDRYRLSTLPADLSFEHMVDPTKMRWRIERGYLDPRQEADKNHSRSAPPAAGLSASRVVAVLFGRNPNFLCSTKLIIQNTSP
jgi:hypothetical protein